MVIKMYLRTQINEKANIQGTGEEKYECNKIQYSTKKGDNS